MNGTMQTMLESSTQAITDGEEQFGKDVYWPVSVQVILAVVVGSTSLLTVIGNLVVIHAYFTTRALQTYTNYFIINLAILDLIGGLFPMPMYGTYWIIGYWPLSLPMCDFYLWVNHTTLHATSIAVLIIAVDRFRSVIYPIKHFSQRNLKYALVWISVCYIPSLLLWTPTIFIWPAVSGRSFPTNICQPEYTNSFGFAAFAQIALFWVPLITMAILYAKVYAVYKKRMGMKKRVKKTEKKDVQTTNVDSGTSSSKNTDSTAATNEDASSTPGSENTSQKQNSKLTIQSPRIRKENNRAVRTLSLIFVVFLLSGVPWAILVVVFKKCPTCIPLALYQTSVYVARISSLLNPLCYAAANTLFRDAFKRVVYFGRRNR